MFRTILELLTKALGRNHPVVQKMARSVEQGDPKVTSIPTQTKLPNIALKDLDIERANSEQIKTAIEEFGKIADLGEAGFKKLPIEQQANVFRNATRFERKLKQDEGIMRTETAKVFDMGTRRQVDKEGLGSLNGTRGKTTRPGRESTLSKELKKTEDKTEEILMRGLEDIKDRLSKISKTKTPQMIDILEDMAKSQQTAARMRDEGLVRATAREIMARDIKSGKLKIPKEEMDVALEYSPVNDPLDIWRKYYGEGALEQLDSMIPDFNKMRSASEAADAASKKFTFTPKAGRPKESFTNEELAKILEDSDPDPDPELFAKGGLAYIMGV